MSSEFNQSGNFPIEQLLGTFANPNLLRTIISSGLETTTSAQTARRRIDIPIDVINDERYMYIYAEIPGVRKESIDIDFYNNKLTLIIDKIRPYDTPEMSEIRYGKSERTITLPICVTRKETVDVNFKDGVLCIKINKTIEEENKFSIRVSEDDKKEPV